MQISWRQLDLDPRLFVMIGMQMSEHVHAVFERHLEALEPALHRLLELGGQSCDELFIGLVDEPVLVSYGKAVRYPHADVLIGANDVVRPRLDLRQTARQPAVDVLDRGDARPDHFEGRVERVEVEIEAATDETGDEP